MSDAPTLEELREAWLLSNAGDGGETPDPVADARFFDRAIAKVKADALREAADNLEAIDRGTSTPHQRLRRYAERLEDRA